ncbi:MAG: hypothetical protein FJ126_04115 [Deltaproteobacteria bacterium]|nr:hypothetical protein [Deltaproteobacteria bacterium]
MPTVDTLKAYETLTAARLPDDQAKAILEVIKASQESGYENLVTRSEFKEEMLALRAEIYRVKYDLLKWLIPLILGQGAIVVALLKFIK